MKIMIAGGGTGGHIYPALSFLKFVQKVNPETKILYIGTKKGLESKIVPDFDIPFKTINAQGFKRSFTWKNLRTIYLFLESVKQAKVLIKNFKPDIVLGMGGYVAGSVLYAATKLNVPTVIHEQNSIPGITNKILSYYVDKVAISFHCVKQHFPKGKVIFTGNPRAQEVFDVKKSDLLKRYDLNPKLLTVVIFGGSRGALKINQTLVEALTQFAEKNYQVLYASGERYYKEFQKKFKQAEMQMKNVRIVPYIKRMAEVLANVDLIVTRAGATSIAEMTSLGLPGILIPSPFVTNDHQTKNAQSLVNVGAIKKIADQDLNVDRLVSAIDEILLDSKLRKQMAVASKNEGVFDASKRLLDVVEKLTKKSIMN
ncbi:MAG: undecaprenyldiphospho-muramoylpentapeptide beta-N-acetylglucosaminyltransferase [Streptococcaceae bacterium]|jgi:UDP-N-acetylglucosamine--N-acetylmuramyl-(pentapeptide) pyrophosphoryl-undecaprenol N-acetylglucosamine transferase|nr:undecaprenyldiphospho-muramoylpentapeptide beta-N-acetylglucosaminyltransferase [Streptococcaceae bacterium]